MGIDFRHFASVADEQDITSGDAPAPDENDVQEDAPEQEGTPAVPQADQPPSCFYCGGTYFEPTEHNGRTMRAECEECGGTQVSHDGIGWNPDLIGSPHNHPRGDADPASGGVGGTGNIPQRTTTEQLRTAMPSRNHSAPEGISFGHREFEPDEDEHADLDAANPGWQHYRLTAHLPEERAVGYIDYSVHPHPNPEAPGLEVNTMGVRGKYQRRGVASAMQDHLRELHPEHVINHGGRSPQGADWWGQYADPAPHLNWDHHESNPWKVGMAGRGEREEDGWTYRKRGPGEIFRGATDVTGPNGEEDSYFGSGLTDVRHPRHVPKPLFHGTRREIPEGAQIEPGHPGNFVKRMKHVYMTDNLGEAYHYSGPNGHVYRVQPTGFYGHRSDAKGSSWASEDPLDVVEKVHGPENGHQASLDLSLGFHLTATWADVRAKAMRIRAEGGVLIKVASPDGVGGEVRGDHGTYETVLSYLPGSRKVGSWHCDCKWGTYAFDRSPAYQRFAGRLCSHGLAMQMEAQSHDRPVSERHPSWMRQHRTRHTVESALAEDVYPEGHGLDLRHPPVYAFAVTAMEQGANAGEALALLLDLGMEHAAGKALVREAVGEFGHLDIQRAVDKARDDHQERHQDDNVLAVNHEPLKASDVPEEHHGGWRFSHNSEAAPRDEFHDLFHDIGAPEMVGERPSHETDPHHAPVSTTSYRHPVSMEALHLDGEGNAWARHFTSKPTDRGTHVPVFQHWSGPHSAMDVLHTHPTFSQGNGEVHWRSHNERLQKANTLPEESYADVHQRKVRRLNESGWGVVGAKDEPEEPPTHAGLVLKAGDTGRVLMLQRSLEDERDPAKGTWEFPGGGLEEDDHNSLHGACREFAEEVGHPVPKGGTLQHVWRSGPYVGHVMVIPSEDDLPLHESRSVDNPDGDHHEQSAWWDPEHARKNPALREECRSSPWKQIGEVSRGTTAIYSVNDPMGSPLEDPPGLGVPPQQVDSENPASTGFATGADPAAFNDATQRSMSVPDMASYASYSRENFIGEIVERYQQPHNWPPLAGGEWPHIGELLATFHAEPEGALPSTDGAEDDTLWDDPGSQVRSEMTGDIDGTESVNPTTLHGASLTPSASEGSVDDIVARFQATAGAQALGTAQGPSDGDIARAAQTHLAKIGVKTFTPSEQQELITEGVREKARARNSSLLQIAGTHYESLAAVLEAHGDPDDCLII